jgi:hypothetical protein
LIIENALSDRIVEFLQNMPQIILGFISEWGGLNVLSCGAIMRGQKAPQGGLDDYLWASLLADRLLLGIWILGTEVLSEKLS